MCVTAGDGWWGGGVGWDMWRGGSVLDLDDILCAARSVDGGWCRRGDVSAIPMRMMASGWVQEVRCGVWDGDAWTAGTMGA